MRLTPENLELFKICSQSDMLVHITKNLNYDIKIRTYKLHHKAWQVT